MNQVCLIAFMTFLFLSFEASSKFNEQKLTSDDDFFSKVDTFYDPDLDYSSFLGRVSDRDSSGNIIKIKTENQNVKFFRPGDKLFFKVAKLIEREECEGYVRDVERDFFVVFVKDFYPCWGKDDYFRRGTQLNFRSLVLAKRVKDAAVYRVILLKRKRDFLRQLNQVNHFIWSFDQEKVQLAAEYDKQIVVIEKKKQKALDFLLVKKKDHINTQKELIYRLDKMDKDLTYYRIEKNQLLMDRWNNDHDLGLPVGKRPQEPKLK